MKSPWELLPVEIQSQPLRQPYAVAVAEPFEDHQAARTAPAGTVCTARATAARPRACGAGISTYVWMALRCAETATSRAPYAGPTNHVARLPDAGTGIGESLELQHGVASRGAPCTALPSAPVSAVSTTEHGKDAAKAGRGDRSRIRPSRPHDHGVLLASRHIEKHLQIAAPAAPAARRAA